MKRLSKSDEPNDLQKRQRGKNAFDAQSDLRLQDRSIAHLFKIFCGSLVMLTFGSFTPAISPSYILAGGFLIAVGAILWTANKR